MGESSFLSQFLMITDLKTVIFIAVLIGTFFIVKQFEKKKVKFSTRTIYATIIGLILGVIIQLVAGLPENPAEVTWLQEVTKWYGLFGSGFMVPFMPGIQDWSFSFGLLVENGNLVYSVLGDLGIIGFIFFCTTYGYLLFKGRKKQGRLILFIAPFLICMGEMVFFSTNNNAILLYVMLAVFLT